MVGSLVIEVIVKKTMELHVFQFDNQLYRQQSGGSIVVHLIGVIADIYVLL